MSPRPVGRHALCFLPLSALTGCLTDNPAPRHPVIEPEPPRAVPAKVDAAPAAANRACAAGVRRAADGLIDDLEDGDTRSAPLGGRTGYWWVAKADRAVVNTPAGAFTSADGGAGGSKKAARFAGKTEANDEWGASVGVAFLEAGFYDASKYAGVEFLIKAAQPNTNVRVKLPDESSHPDAGLCTQCWNAFGKDLMVGPEWQKVTVLFSELAQEPSWGAPRPPAVTPARIKNIEWAVPKGVEFDVVVDDIAFVECQ